MTDRRKQTFDAGFDFARRMGDPDFRDRLEASGWQTGSHIVMAVDDEAVVDVVCKVMLHSGSKAFIAITGKDDEDDGFRMLSVRVARERKRDALLPFLREDAIPLGPGLTIGMLYDSLRPAHPYVPGDWSKNLLFEKVAA